MLGTPFPNNPVASRRKRSFEHLAADDRDECLVTLVLDVDVGRFVIVEYIRMEIPKKKEMTGIGDVLEWGDRKAISRQPARPTADRRYWVVGITLRRRPKRAQQA